MRSYARQDILSFGSELLYSGDLDPIYIMLQKANLPYEQLGRWLMSYWCFYHAGLASYLSEFERDEFWDWFFIAAQNSTMTPVNGRWPRAAERRHFRGRSALTAVTALRNLYGNRPSGMVDYLCENEEEGGGPIPFEVVRAKAQEHYMFGEWLSFKVADMIERVLHVPMLVSMDNVMYSAPKEAALLLDCERFPGPEPITDQERIDRSVIYLIDHFSKFRNILGLDDRRPVSLLEIETILCKWKSHRSGHYPPGNDLIEIRRGTEPWSFCKTAETLLQHLPLSVYATGTPVVYKKLGLRKEP